VSAQDKHNAAERSRLPNCRSGAREIKARLQFLLDVGLDYLSLDRPAMTLSGGEAQRINWQKKWLWFNWRSLSSMNLVSDRINAIMGACCKRLQNCVI